MIRECFKTNTGIMFDAERLKNVGLDAQTLYPFVTPRPPSRSPGSSKILKRPKEEKGWRFPWSKKPSAAPSTAAPSEKDRLLSRPPSPFPPVASVSEEEEELLDALSPKYDQLKLKPFWWILEFIPMEYRFQVGKDNRWVSYFGYVPFCLHGRCTSMHIEFSPQPKQSTIENHSEAAVGRIQSTP